MSRLLDSYPNVVLPLKAALAALIAWLVVEPVGGFIDDYQYYAPLGAVLTMSPALSRAARSGVHAVVAIVAGGLLAIGVQALPLPQPIAIAITVGAGVACSYSKWVGGMGSWVPFVALFALVLHELHPWHYVLAYVLLAGLGALIGLLVDILFPQVPTGPALVSERRLSGELAHALETLGEAISSTTALGDARRDALRSSLDDRSHDLRNAIRQISDARRVNWRARAADGRADRIERHARSLQRLTDGVAYVLEIADTTVDSSTADGKVISEGLPPPLKSELVHALARAAESLREGSSGSSGKWTSHDRSALIRLRESLAKETAQLGDEPRLALMGVAAELQRIADGHRASSPMP